MVIDCSLINALQSNFTGQGKQKSLNQTLFHRTIPLGLQNHRSFRRSVGQWPPTEYPKGIRSNPSGIGHCPENDEFSSRVVPTCRHWTFLSALGAAELRERTRITNAARNPHGFCPADEVVVGDQSGQPFLAGHLGRLALQKAGRRPTEQRFEKLPSPTKTSEAETFVLSPPLPSEARRYDSFVASTLHPRCTSVAPPLHLRYTSVAPPLHLRCTSVAPPYRLRRYYGGVTEVLRRCNGGTTEVLRRYYGGTTEV